MNSESIFKKLNVLESSLDLSQFQIEGIDVWPLLRFQFVIKLNAQILGSEPSAQSYLARVGEKTRLIPGALRGLFKQFIHDIWKGSSYQRNADILLLTDTSAKRMQINGKWFDAFVDPILDHYEHQGISYQILETSQRFLFRSPGIRPSVLLLWTMIWSYAKSLITARKVNFSDRFLESYSTYEKMLGVLDVRGGQVNLRELQMETSYILQLIPVFEKIIQHTSPKIVFMVPYNGYSGRALTYVCKRFGIQSVDIQHGIQGNYHPAYAQFSNVPKEGFNTLPSTFLTWSDNDTREINAWAAQIQETIAITLGNLFQNMFLGSNPHAISFDAIFQNTYIEKWGKRFILISLIWDHFLPEEFKELLKNSREDYYFLIRFHPSTTDRERQIVRRELASLDVENYDLDSATKLPLYAVLRNVELNITQRSSTVIEAAHFGVPSFISDEIGIAYYSEYIESGRAFEYSGTEGILQFMDKSFKLTRDPQSDNRSDYRSVLDMITKVGK